MRPKHNWKATSDGPHGEYMGVCTKCGRTDFEADKPCIERNKKSPLRFAKG